jgi:hypothetical protein
MFMQTKIYYTDHVWNNGFPDCLAPQEFLLLGDPSLKIGGYEKR